MRPPASDNQQKQYQLFHHLRRINTESQEGDPVQGASGSNSAGYEPRFLLQLTKGKFFCGCHMTACCLFSCRCAQ